MALKNVGALHHRIPTELLIECCSFLGIDSVQQHLQLVSLSFYNTTQTWLHSPDGTAALFKEGIGYQLGLDHKTIADDKGQAMIEAAAGFKCLVAEAYCDLEGWGGRAVNHGQAFRTLLQGTTAKTHHNCTTSVQWSEFLVGYCLFHGYGDETTPNSGSSMANPSEAVHWYKKAAKRGLCVAQNHLALMMLHNEGGLTMDDEDVVVDDNNDDNVYLDSAKDTNQEWVFSKAYRLLWHSAKQGNCRARYGWSLGFVDLHKRTEFSDGLEDFVNQRDWWLKSKGCVGGDSDDLTGDGDHKLTVVRGDMMRRACQQGHDEAQFEMGLYVMCSAATGHDGIAFMWDCMTKASVQGHGVAQCHLARMYEKKGDKSSARIWYEKSAQHHEQEGGNGVPEAQFSLAGYHLYGYGGLRSDPHIALAWYTRAAAQGHAMAQQDAETLVEMGVELT